MELAVGEVLGGGMFVFCAVQGLIALVSPFRVRPVDYLRDCAFYVVSILLTAFVLLDGSIVVWEGMLMCGLYVLYVLIVIYNDDLLQMLGADASLTKEPEAVEEADAAPAEEEQAARRQEALKQYYRLLDENDSPLSLLLQFLTPFETDGFGDLPIHDKAYTVLAAPVVMLLKVPSLQRLFRSGCLHLHLCLRLFFLPYHVCVCVRACVRVCAWCVCSCVCVCVCVCVPAIP